METTKHAKTESKEHKSVEHKNVANAAHVMNNAGSYVAVVLVRGLCKTRQDIKDTLLMLGITKKNAMTIRKLTPSIEGMVKKVKDYVTYGIVTEDASKKYGLNTTFNLHPPRGGFERKGIKVAYSHGGALGNRGIEMIKLIERMHK